MTYTPRPCAWADANPDRTREGFRNCTSWNGCVGKKCNRRTYAQQEAAKITSAYRKFPGNDLQQARGREPLPAAHCRWCEGEIMDRKRGCLAIRRTWHIGRDGEPDCLSAYYSHTDSKVQFRLLVQRDGPMCKCCGVKRGSDVDHVLALGLVVLIIPEPERWKWWGLMNLQILCFDCHKAKTREDVRKIRNARQSQEPPCPAPT